MTIREFPSHGLLPKDEIQAAQFVKKYPEYDGRGVVVAILDTGVDPGAAGLQVTTDVKPKILDVIDCAGSGDVDTTKIVKVGDDGIITGLSGRKLEIPKDWKNPSGECRIGMKRAYELWPRNLVTRIKNERKKKFLDKHHDLVTACQRDLAALDLEKVPEKGVEDKKEATPASEDVNTNETVKPPSKDASTDIESPKDNEKSDKAAVKADLKARVEALGSLKGAYDDAGPVFDCILWNDGSEWNAVVDVNESGKAENYTVLQEYNISQKHATFGHQDQLNYAVHVYDEGKVLSIVTVAGSHGTHVAGIVSANYADTPDLNGCAPGAQIVSLKIGDTRLGSMETGQAFTRAVIEIVRHKVDIINISYGEDASLPDKGRIIELLRDVLTRDHGVVVVSSAGNAGPALTTSGSPGATSSNVIGVGAWVSSAMMQAAYSLLNPVDENIFTWSSRGPTADGARGMSVYAPGGAITSVANYELEKSRLMNGTSMSSPNACGGISLVLSALKAQNLPYTPYGIRKAVEYTGMDIKGSEGPGLLQVDKAYEYLISYKDVTDLGIAFEVKVPHNGKQQRGIYLRDPIETSKIQRYKANVTPKFKEEQTTEAVALDLKLALVSTASWVRVPAALAMTGGGRAFDVQVDPTSLPVGDHYADVHAYDVATPNRVVFTVPITVTKPITVPADTNTISFKDQKFIPGQIQRRFVAVPDGATMAELRLRSQGHSSPIMSFTHLVQLHPQTRHVDSQEQYVLTIVENEPTAKTFKVRGGVTLEVCISQFWSSLGDMNLDIEVEFFGLDVVGGKPIAIAGGEGLQKVEFASRLRNEDLEPSISLDNLRKFIRPTESKMNSLTDRDRLPDGRVIFERVLTYNIKQVTDSNPTVKFSWPFAHHVYESALDSNLWFLFDAATKERIQFGDAVPRPEKLAKGDYILRLQLRHDDVEILERLKNLPVIMDIKLGKSASLDISSDHIEAFRKKNPSFSKVRLSAGSRIAIQVNTNIESLPKDAKLGDLLTGQMSCGKGRAPKFPVTYIIAPEPIIKGDGDEAPAAKAEVTMLDMQVGALKKLTKDEEKETLLKTLIKEHPDHLAVRVAQLDALTEGSEKTKPADVVEAADAIIKLVDAQELAVFFAQKHPSQIPLTDADKKKRKEMTEKKSALVEALRRKLLVETGDEKTFNLYSQYIDDFSKDGKALMVYAKREITQGRHGNALKCIVKYLGDVQRGDSGVQATAKKVRDLRTECLKALGWKLWVDYYTSWALVHEPGSYALF